MKFDEYRFDEITLNYDKERIPLSAMERGKRQGKYRYYGAQGIIDYVNDYIFDGKYLLIAEDGENLKSKKQNIAQIVEGQFWVNNHAHIVKCNEKCILEYLAYIMNCKDISGYITGSAQPKLSQANLKAMTFNIPPVAYQKKCLNVLLPIEHKIKLNTTINNNLEEQLSALFVNMFGHFIDSLDNSDIKLGDLIESVDNRGKTPPLSDEPTDYPIIDVRALSGNSRIIDYTNCTKYVSKETYNNWFRSGHPKEYDILISTVGSLAEMKIFLGTTGCIAQNVVGFRTKGISPLYLYQYLNYIKNDLVAYNIGSVQPSIKITHIIKHSIYVASKEDIEIFDSIARDITKKIFANCQENEALKQMRDTLLPKLMSGELDVSDIEV